MQLKWHVEALLACLNISQFNNLNLKSIFANILIQMRHGSEDFYMSQIECSASDSNNYGYLILGTVDASDEAV